MLFSDNLATLLKHVAEPGRPVQVHCQSFRTFQTPTLVEGDPTRDWSGVRSTSHPSSSLAAPDEEAFLSERLATSSTFASPVPRSLPNMTWNHSGKLKDCANLSKVFMSHEQSEPLAEQHTLGPQFDTAWL